MLMQQKNKIQLESIMQNLDNIKSDIRDDAESILMRILVNDSDYNQQKKIIILALYNYSTKKFRLELKKNCSKTSAFMSNHYPKLNANEIDINNDLPMVLPISRIDLMTKYIVVDNFTEALDKMIKRKVKQILKEWNLTALHPRENLRTIISFLNFTMDLKYGMSGRNINRTYFIPLNAISAKELTRIVQYLGDKYEEKAYLNFSIYPFESQLKNYYDFAQLSTELSNIINNCKYKAANVINTLSNFIIEYKLDKLKQDIKDHQITGFDFQKINQDGLMILPKEIRNLALQFDNTKLLKSYIKYYQDYNEAVIEKVLMNKDPLSLNPYRDLSFTTRYAETNYKHCFNSNNSSEYVYVWLDRYLTDAESIKEYLISDFINQEPYAMGADVQTVTADKPDHLVYFVNDIENFKQNVKLAVRQVSDNLIVQKQLFDLIKKYPFKIITLGELMNDDSIYEVSENLLPNKTTFLRAMSDKLEDGDVRKLVSNRKVFNTSVSDKIILHKF